MQMANNYLVVYPSGKRITLTGKFSLVPLPGTESPVVTIDLGDEGIVALDPRAKIECVDTGEVVYDGSGGRIDDNGRFVPATMSPYATRNSAN